MTTKGKKPGKLRTLKARAAYYARPLETRPREMDALKKRQTLRAEHVLGQDILAKKHERARITTMLNENISPQLRETLIKQRHLIK
jgi:hypothetical protein